MTVLNIEHQDGVRVLTMQRPERHNALNTELTRGLLQALQDAGSDDDCRAIVLTGSGKSFCAGGDTTEFAAFGQDANQASARGELTASLHAVFSTVHKPIVSAVWGNAMGGGAGLALACDMMVTCADTRFGYPEIKRGLCPAIVMANLTRQVGIKRAFELVSTARMLNGHELYDWGLSARVTGTPPDTLEAALTIARTWASYRTQSLRATKQLFYQALDLDFSEGLDTGRRLNIEMRRYAQSNG